MHSPDILSSFHLLPSCLVSTAAELLTEYFYGENLMWNYRNFMWSESAYLTVLLDNNVILITLCLHHNSPQYESRVSILMTGG